MGPVLHAKQTWTIALSTFTYHIAKWVIWLKTVQMSAKSILDLLIWSASKRTLSAGQLRLALCPGLLLLCGPRRDALPAARGRHRRHVRHCPESEHPVRWAACHDKQGGSNYPEAQNLSWSHSLSLTEPQLMYTWNGLKEPFLINHS